MTRRRWKGPVWCSPPPAVNRNPSLNRMYLQEQQLTVESMGRGMAWLDTGTFTSMRQGPTSAHSSSVRV